MYTYKLNNKLSKLEETNYREANASKKLRSKKKIPYYANGFNYYFILPLFKPRARVC